MPATNFTPIQLYRSATASQVPTSGNLSDGELAINTNDEKLYFKNSGGTVKLLASSAGASGDVVGPASATDNAVVRFDGTTGKLVQNSVVTIADSTGDISGVGQLNATTVDATNVEVTNIKAKDGTAAATIADSTGVVSITANPILSGGTANGVLYLNGSKVATSGSALTFDGTEFINGNGGIIAKGASALSSGAGGYLYYTSGTTSVELTALSPGVAWLNQKYNALTHIWNISGSEQMRLNSTGLGIGTSSPGVKLDIFEQRPNDNTKSTFRISVESAPGNQYAARIAAAKSVGGIPYMLVMGPADSNGYLAFTTGVSDTERMRLDSSGNLGLGVTPSRLFDAQKDQNSATQFRIRNDNNGTASQSSVSASYGDFSQYITMAQYSPSFTTSGLRAANSSGVFTTGNTNGLRVYTLDSTPLIFGTADTERARITSGGDLLVGTTSAGSLNGRAVVAGASGISSIGTLATGGTGALDTGISINQGDGGGCIVLVASRNTSNATSTDAAVYIVRFYYDGNNAPTTTYVGGSSDFVTFGTSGSNTLTLTNAGGGNSKYAWFGNK